MGILNVTPDSFSDGGQFLDPTEAIARAAEMARQGADILDIGAESTRPYGGAIPVSADDEKARLAPVLSEVVKLGLPVSIDTIKASIAAWAIEQGADIVNDVWGLQRDARLADVVAAAEAIIVIMHNRASKDETIDILADIRSFFDRSLGLARAAGIPERHVILDPGIGFAKTSRQNREALARLAELKDYDLPIMVGVSRKAFLGSLTDGAEASLVGTLAANLAAVAAGASIFRVHDVAEHVAALKVFHTIRQP